MKNEIKIIPNPFMVLEKDESLLTQNTFYLELDSAFENKREIVKNQILYCNVKNSFTLTENSGTRILIQKSEIVKDFSLTQEESYYLQISTDSENKGISIIANTFEGIFLGLQSFKQLLISNSSELPCTEIFDKPAYSWRSFMLDTSRAFYSVSFIKKMLDAAALHKMNKFHWHLTDDQGWRINIPEYPLLTQTGSVREAPTMPPTKDTYNDIQENQRHYYTDEEIKDIVEYAENLNITVIPEIELPGHVSALLAAYPEFGCTGGPYNVENRWGIFPDVLCLGNDKIFDIYSTIFKTIVRLFPSKWIHIGGDECLPTRWKECPKCQNRKKQLKLDTEAQLQSWVTTKMAEIIISMGKIPIGWDEVLDNTEKYPLPAEVAVQSWRNEGGGEKATALKHFTIMSPVNKTYMNFKPYDCYEEPGRLGITTVKQAYSFIPVDNLSEEQKKYILGAECNLWAEALPSSKVVEYLVFPRLCALSECMWLSEDKKDFNRFAEALTEHKKRLKILNYLFYDGKLE